MRTYFFLFVSLLVILFFPACDGEINTDFPTDIIQHSQVSDSIFDILLDDAKLICLNLYTNEESQEINSVEIDETHIGPIVAALQMVYIDSLTTETQEIRNYNIHALCRIQLHEGYLVVDSTSTNVQSWLRNGYSTNGPIDEFIYQYDILLDSINKENYRYYTDYGLNHLALAKQLVKAPFIKKANPIACVGDGSQIEIMSFNSDYIHLIYSYGWGDCPSGCIYRHYWEIGIQGSGIIEVIDDYGNKLP